MKSGPEIVKAGLRSFFESAADDIEKMVENLKLGKVSKGNQVKRKRPYIEVIYQPVRLFNDLSSTMYLLSSQQVKGVSQNINYTTIALLPVLTSLFDHIAQHLFGDDVMREYISRPLRFLALCVCTPSFTVFCAQWTTCRCPATASCAASTHWEPSRIHMLRGNEHEHEHEHTLTEDLEN